MTTATEIPATPAKLRNGNWGARVKGAPVSAGDVVQITTKSGKSWSARVIAIVWSGKGVTLCATESLDRAPARSTRRARCSCTDPSCECHTGRCMCGRECNCRGGNIYDC
jgi:hypothetical protein